MVCDYDDFFRFVHYDEIINHQHYDQDHDANYDYDDTDDPAGTRCPIFLPLRAKQIARRFMIMMIIMIVTMMSIRIIMMLMIMQGQSVQCFFLCEQNS